MPRIRTSIFSLRSPHPKLISVWQLNTTALSDSFVSWFSGRNAHNGDFLHALAKEAGKPEGDAALDSLTASLILEVVPTAPLFSKAMTHVVNFFLQDGREQLRGQLATVAGQKTPQADAEVMKFVYEALREYHSSPSMFVDDKY